MATSVITEVQNSTLFGLRLTAGDIPGYDYIHKFGANPSITTTLETVWAQGGIYTYPSDSGVTLYISSSENTDAGKSINISGLDENFLEKSVTITLDGTDAETKTEITGHTWTRIFRAFNAGSTDLDGDVYIYEDDTVSAGVPDTATKIRAKIVAAEQQTQLALYTIPANKIGCVNRASMSSGRNVDIDFKLYTRLFGGVFRLSYQWSTFRSNVIDRTDIPLTLPGKTDIEFRAITPSGTASNVTAGFSVITLDRYQGQ